MLKICLLLLTTGAVMAADDRSKNDQEKLRGTWRTVSLVSNGKTIVSDKSPPAAGPETKLIYDGDNWKIQTGDQVLASGKFKVDASKIAERDRYFRRDGRQERQDEAGHLPTRRRRVPVLSGAGQQTAADGVR